MALAASFSKKHFEFSFKARTSRGLMREKASWFIELIDQARPSIVGIGECGPLPGLSPESMDQYEELLQRALQSLAGYADAQAVLNDLGAVVPREYPSLTFGIETACYDLHNGGRRIIFDNGFLQGSPIPINGLIWMGDLDFMMSQINDKVKQGFRCIKLKVGGLDFDRECDVLSYIRKRYFRENIEIRLDANGAFKTDDCLYKLNALAKYTIHSIEQPLKPGMEEAEELCRVSPIPIALDEELILHFQYEDKLRLLKRLKPQYIILKPSLHGGMAGCREWISIAENLNIGWWITSALESSIGLNAIAQFVSNYSITMPQGLGTGMIYTNNIDSPLEVSAGTLRYNSAFPWGELHPSLPVE